MIKRADQYKSWVDDADTNGNRLGKIFDHFPDVLYVVNLAGEIEYISQASFHHLGYRPEEMIGHPMADYYVNPKDRDKIFGPLMAKPGEIVNLEFPLQHKNGSTVWASTDARIFLNENGEPQGIEGVSRDISGRKQTELLLEANQEELARARDQALKLEEAARQANEAKTRFLTNISHEMRTPLTGILGALDLIEDPNLSERSDELIETARSSGRSLLNLINELLDIARLESGQVVIQEAEFSLGELLIELCASFRVLAVQKGIEFVLEVTDNFPAGIVADRRRIVQVLSNFLGNAIKFTETGQVTLRAAMQVVDDEQAHVLIEVEDTGAGIAPDQIEKIFERFERVEEERTRQIGAGLGLAISREYVELMGGKISVSSELEKGSIFSLELTASSVDLKSKVCGDQDISEQTLPADLKILIADDKRTNRMLVGFMLERYGIKADFAASGEEALERLEKAGYDFDVVLMDIQMTGITGIEATRQIRDSGGPNKDVPVLAFTADIFPEQMSAYWEAGMNGYISKPIDQDKLVAEINLALRKRARMRVDQKAAEG